MKYSVIIFDRKDRSTPIHTITGPWQSRDDAVTFGIKFCVTFYPKEANILFRVIDATI
jgi:hypothetical protein